METYNGWNNHETWLVYTWTSNDNALYNTMLDLASKYSSIQEIADDIKTAILNWLEDEIDGSGLGTDLVYASLARVNWVEIATHYTTN